MEEQQRFFVCESPERIVRGGNRGGKTLAVAVEIARALTGQDPHRKYSDPPVVVVVVGFDLRHCAKVLFKKLFKPGAFLMIRDLATGKWRAYRPNDPSDAARVYETKPARPLIPRRFYDYKAIAWEEKKGEVAKCVTLKNGSELHFFSSKSNPPQGWAIHLVAFDEEIEQPIWYPEMAARLLDNRIVNPKTGKVLNGRFIWSATPQAGTQVLYDLCARAKEQAEEAGVAPTTTPVTSEFVLGMLDNSFMSEGAKQELIAKIGNNEDEYRVRVLGDFALLGSRVYGDFAPHGVHGMEAFPIPDDWTRYAFIDPGRQVCAVLFVAIPPTHSEYAGRKFIYDELYIKRCSAKIFAERMRDRLVAQTIEAWWIDHHAGRMTEIASGLTPEEQYSAALKSVGVRCQRTGFNFLWASDDVAGGIEAVRAGLHIQDGHGTWVVLKGKCPNFIWEASIYSYKRTPAGVATDDPVKLHNHLMDCWRYAALADLRWRKPKPKGLRKGPNDDILAAKRAKHRKEHGWGDCIKLG
jgi:hypothetical protein